MEKNGLFVMTSMGLKRKSIDVLNKKPGVWMLIGKKKEEGHEEGHFICIQIGQTGNIGLEVKRDIEFMVEAEPKSSKKKYVNQFGEVQFEYDDYANWRAKQLYYIIAKEYKELKFICIICERNTKEQRDKLEKYMAYKSSCKYWVNGRPFSAKKENDRKQYCIGECEVIKKELQKFFNHELLQKIDNFILNMSNKDFEDV